MTTFFVFYNDGPRERGGVGVQECGFASEACEFIESRIAADKNNRHAGQYTVIHGHRLNVKPVSVVTKIKLLED